MIVIMSDWIDTLFEDARVHHFAGGSAAFHIGDPVRRLFRVVTGHIDMLRHSTQGTPLLLHRIGPGDVVAEASVYSDTYHCDGIAVGGVELLSLPVTRFRARLRDTPEAAEAWAALLAHTLQATRLRSEIRSLRTVAERLEAWLGPTDQLPPRGEWHHLAARLGVSREALYRELARRRQAAKRRP